MIDAKKLVESIIVFVNFFTIRIAVTCFVAALLYKLSGRYYFDLATTYLGDKLVTGQEVQSYIAKGSDFVTEANIKNTIFAVAVLVSLSLLDILYRLFGALGSLLPVRMIPYFNAITRQYQPVILTVWRRCSKQYQPEAFIELVEKQSLIQFYKISGSTWWVGFFNYTKSSIIAVLLACVFTPHAALKLSMLQIVGLIAIAICCMWVCVVIEAAWTSGVFLSLLAATVNELGQQAKEEAISDTEYKEATKYLERPDLDQWWRPNWYVRFTCVKLTFLIPYVLSSSDIRQIYQDSRKTLARKK